MASGDRIALFYEDYEYARILDFRYIRNGLMNGERCIYLSLNHNEDKADNNYSHGGNRNKKNSRDIREENNKQIVEFIKQNMIDNDIDVASSLAEGALYIGTISKQQLLNYCKKLSSKINEHELLKSMLPNSLFETNTHSSSSISAITLYRLVIDLGLESDADQESILSDALKFEEACHFAFHSLQGSSICSYSTQDIGAALTDYSKYGNLVNIRLGNHNGVIFARRFGKDLALVLE